MKINELITKNEWDLSYKENFFKINHNVFLKHIFSRHVQEFSSVFEFGCYPGTFLNFLAETKQCELNGLDYSEYMEEMISRLTLRGYSMNRFFNEDVRNFNSEDLKFDVVYSVGFLEHFDNSLAILDYHISVLSNSGTLIISIPNFRYCQFFLRNFLKSETLQGHNLEAMNLDYLCKYLKSRQLRIVESGYIETCDYWVNFKKMKFIFKVINIPIIALLRLLNRCLNLPNKFISPYMYIVAKK